MAPRPLWQTLVVGGLLSFLPVVGVSMATMYWLTRDEPDQFRAGEAAGAGVMVIVMGVLVAVALFVVISATMLVLMAILQVLGS
jgi:hypothetical protein